MTKTQTETPMSTRTRFAIEPPLSFSFSARTIAKRTYESRQFRVPGCSFAFHLHTGSCLCIVNRCFCWTRWIEVAIVRSVLRLQHDVVASRAAKAALGFENREDGVVCREGKSPQSMCFLRNEPICNCCILFGTATAAFGWGLQACFCKWVRFGNEPICGSITTNHEEK